MPWVKRSITQNSLTFKPIFSWLVLKLYSVSCYVGSILPEGERGGGSGQLWLILTNSFSLLSVKQHNVTAPQTTATTNDHYGWLLLTEVKPNVQVLHGAQNTTPVTRDLCLHADPLGLKGTTSNCLFTPSIAFFFCRITQKAMTHTRTIDASPISGH